MKKILSLLLISGLVMSALSGCGSSDSNDAAKQTGKDAIKVNDTILKSDYLNKRINQIFKHNQIQADDPTADYFKAQVITSLVNTELLRQEADRRGIKVTDEDLKKLKEESIKAYESEDNFKRYMKEYDVSEEDFENMMKEQIRYNKLSDELRKEIKVDPKAYYDEHKDQFKMPEQVKAAHILVKDEAQAKEIIKKISNGEDFANLAKEYSEDPGSKDKGGDLGYFSADSMVKEFSAAAFAMKPGDVSKEPVKSQFGYHIIKVEDKKPAHQQSFDEAKEQITEQLTANEVNQKLQELVTKLTKDAKIEYLLDDYNPEKLMSKAQEAAQKAQKATENKAKGEDSTKAEDKAKTENKGSKTEEKQAEKPAA